MPSLSSAYLCTNVVSQLVDGRPLDRSRRGHAAGGADLVLGVDMCISRGTRAAQEQSPLSHSQAHERATSVLEEIVPVVGVLVLVRVVIHVVYCWDCDPVRP